MLQTQVNYWNLVEQKRHNVQTEQLTKESNRIANRQADAAVSQAETAKGNLEVNKRNAATNEYNATINAANAAVNAQNAESNAMNAKSNAMNAATNAYNATINQQNANTKYLEYVESGRHNKATESIQQQQADAATEQARIAGINAQTNLMNAYTNKGNLEVYRAVSNQSILESRERTKNITADTNLIDSKVDLTREQATGQSLTNYEQMIHNNYVAAQEWLNMLNTGSNVYKNTVVSTGNTLIDAFKAITPWE